MQEILFQDIYALEWGTQSTLPAPEGIDRFFSDTTKTSPTNFYIRDANYYPNSHKTLETINTIRGQNNQPEFDIMIGIHLSLLEDIITEMGGIQVYDQYIQGSDIASFLSLIVESKIATISSPKDILTDVAEEILTHLDTHAQMFTKVILRHLETGEIVVAGKDKNIQKAIDSLELFDPWKYHV